MPFARSMRTIERQASLLSAMIDPSAFVKLHEPVSSRTTSGPSKSIRWNPPNLGTSFTVCTPVAGRLSVRYPSAVMAGSPDGVGAGGVGAGVTGAGDGVAVAGEASAVPVGPPAGELAPGPGGGVPPPPQPAARATTARAVRSLAATDVIAGTRPIRLGARSSLRPSLQLPQTSPAPANQSAVDNPAALPDAAAHWRRSN